MGVLLQSFFFGPGRVTGVPSPLDGDQTVPFWWDHLAAQAQDFGRAGFTAIWIPCPLKGRSGANSSGYDPFDDYDLGSKNQKGTVPTRYGSRQQLERCAAMMRANGIDLYVDMVENHRDGDDGHFNFHYADAFGNPTGGRFEKGPGDFHPHVPEDPGVFSDQITFGRDLAPINGVPKDHCAKGLLDAADWLTRALDAHGYRLDDAKGVSTVFVRRLLHTGAMANKFSVAEFGDGNRQLVENWANDVGHRSAAFDFPLHFALKDMCNNPDSFDMSSLDHAGLAGDDPRGAVTFVENHDSDAGGFSGPIVRNKLLGYAYILTAEGYPCVFYRDYSTDKNCFGFKAPIDRLIWIHENLAGGATVQRFKDRGVFAFERLGGGHLLVGLNKDANASRTITVATGFPPHTQLRDFTDHEGTVTTNAQSRVTITIPKNDNGTGYVCYAPPAQVNPFSRNPATTTQDYEGAADLDIKPAVEGTRVEVCRIFAEAHTELRVRLSFDASKWTPLTTIQLNIDGPDGLPAGSGSFDQGAAQSASLTITTLQQGFHALSVQSANTPAGNKNPSYKVSVTYSAPQTI